MVQVRQKRVTDLIDHPLAHNVNRLLDLGFDLSEETEHVFLELSAFGFDRILNVEFFSQQVDLLSSESFAMSHMRMVLFDTVQATTSFFGCTVLVNAEMSDFESVFALFHCSKINIITVRIKKAINNIYLIGISQK